MSGAGMDFLQLEINKELISGPIHSYQNKTEQTLIFL